MSDSNEIPDECAFDSQYNDHYNVSLHIGAIFIILGLSALSMLIPFLSFKSRFSFLHSVVFPAGKAFGAGTVISVAIVHIWAESQEALSSVCLPAFLTENVPMLANVIVLAAIFTTHALELFGMRMYERHLLSCETHHCHHAHAAERLHEAPPHGHARLSMDGSLLTSRAPSVASHYSESRDDHSHHHRLRADGGGVIGGGGGGGGGATPGHARPSSAGAVHPYHPPELQANPLATLGYTSPTFSSNTLHSHHDHHSHHHDHHSHHHHSATTTVNADDLELGGSKMIIRNPLSPPTPHSSSSHSPPCNHVHLHLAPAVTLLSTDARNKLVIVMLEASIAIHSVLIGISLGVESATKSFKPLLIAICVHQFFEGIALASALAEARFTTRRWRLLAAFIFCLSTPIGIAIGIGVHSSYNGNGVKSLVLEGVFGSIAAGILLYVSLTEMLAEWYLRSEEFRRGKLLNILLILLSMYSGAAVMAALALWA